MHAAERILTPWLTIIGKRAPKAPLITVTLTSVGSELRSAHAAVSAPDDAYLAYHPALVQEYAHADRWPKHVLILYKWEQRNDVDAESGLFVLLLSGAGLVGEGFWGRCEASLLQPRSHLTRDAVRSARHVRRTDGDWRGQGG